MSTIKIPRSEAYDFIRVRRRLKDIVTLCLERDMPYVSSEADRTMPILDAFPAREVVKDSGSHYSTSQGTVPPGMYGVVMPIWIDAFGGRYDRVSPRIPHYSPEQVLLLHGDFEIWWCVKQRPNPGVEYPKEPMDRAIQFHVWCHSPEAQRIFQSCDIGYENCGPAEQVSGSVFETPNNLYDWRAKVVLRVTWYQEMRVEQEIKVVQEEDGRTIFLGGTVLQRASVRTREDNREENLRAEDEDVDSQGNKLEIQVQNLLDPQNVTMTEADYRLSVTGVTPDLRSLEYFRKEYNDPDWARRWRVLTPAGVELTALVVNGWVMVLERAEDQDGLRSWLSGRNGPVPDANELTFSVRLQHYGT